MEQHEGKNQLPFKIVQEENTDFDDLTIDVELKEPASNKKKQELEDIMTGWASLGIDMGYGDGIIHDWSEEENEWDKGDTRFRFWVDMGSCDEKALDALYEQLTNFNDIEKVNLGSRYDN
jgi:hypothetical protein